MKHYLKISYPFLRPFLAPFLWATSLSLPMAAIKGYQTYLVKNIFDQGFSSSTTTAEVLKLGLLILALQLINYPIRFYHFFKTKVISEALANNIRANSLSGILSLPLIEIQKRKMGEMLSLISSDSTLYAESVRYFPALIREPLTGLVLLGVAFYHDWFLSLMVIIISPLFILIFSKTGKSIRRRVVKVQQATGQVTHTISELLSGSKTIKAYNLQNYAKERVQKDQAEYLGHYTHAASMEEQSGPLVEVVAALVLGVVLLSAHHRIQLGLLTTGGFISFLTAFALFLDPIRKFSDANIKIERGIGALERILKLLNLPNEPVMATKKALPFTNAIEVENINFSYGGNQVLSQFSMKVPKGKKVALVGLSGSGKSTIMNLLMNFYQPTSGKIKIDDQALDQIPLYELRSLFAYVGQEVFLFNDSIKENIVTDHTFDEATYQRALEISHSQDFVAELPQGSATSIGDRGLRLSGGQAQRITIARAIMRDAPILLFDEATSALDNESEKIVQNAIEKMSGNKTVIAVAHRLTTIQNFDHIIVLKDGKKVEEGNHESLMSLGGEYRKLYELSRK
ncbi:MAG: ABC transporter ATP-binding protein [Bacteriovoracaceae bacterium]|nr:ABC transporter ATP-binding protein [Bacteriovoracaceae bacterium]